MNGQSGMLVAFPSTLLHEVEPVVAGTRYSVSAVFASPNLV